MYVRVLTVFIAIFQLGAAIGIPVKEILALQSTLRVVVTKEQCGRSIDLTWKRKVYLDYEGAELWNESPTCVINITTRNYNEKMCIKNKSTALIDLKCSETLSYYVGGYKGYSAGNEKSCTDFSLRAFCDSNRVSSVVYRESFLYDSRNITVNVIVYLSRIRSTTTWPSYTRASWSSWSSWSSSYDNDEKPKSSKTKGLVVGLIVTAGALVVGCICAMLRERIFPTRYYSAPPAVENAASAPEIEPSAPLVHYQQGNLDESHTLNSAEGFLPQRQSDSAGYHTHGSTNQQVPNQDTQAGNKSDQPPPSYDSLPSAPPPPYPGY